MGAPKDFIDIALQDLKGQPEQNPQQLHEQACADSPAMASFVEQATRDLMYGADADKVHESAAPGANAHVDVHENADALRNAFAKSITEGAPASKEAGELIEEFKETAGKEAEETLQKLLKGLR